MLCPAFVEKRSWIIKKNTPELRSPSKGRLVFANLLGYWIYVYIYIYLEPKWGPIFWKILGPIKWCQTQPPKKDVLLRQELGQRRLSLQLPCAGHGTGWYIYLDLS